MSEEATFRCVVKTPIGELLLQSDGTSLTACRPLAQAPPDAQQELPVFRQAAAWLKCFFGGDGECLCELPPLAPQGTPFQQRVWRELQKIPYGTTTTYGAIARAVSCRSAQAVGGAIGKNPIAIFIPCHRVIGADGGLVGYAWGLPWKEALLRIEKEHSV